MVNSNTEPEREEENWTASAGPREVSIAVVCAIAELARIFDEKVAPFYEQENMHSPPDEEMSILEYMPDDPSIIELSRAIESLNVDQKAELIALMWLGRDDFEVEEWEAAVTRARELDSRHTAAYLTGTPLLGDYLEEGLAQLGMNCEEYRER